MYNVLALARMTAFNKYGAVEKSRTSTGLSPTATSTLRVYHSATTAFLLSFCF